MNGRTDARKQRHLRPTFLGRLCRRIDLRTKPRFGPFTKSSLETQTAYSNPYISTKQYTHSLTPAWSYYCAKAILFRHRHHV